ncbi:fimbrial protein [Aquitalea denitrificans]|uniref:fimbrial protein n=1 Tax=Aquitalea denitrificans TaxID=519081 RepID=UPI001358FD23|nr:fimbrial protein [Aquitalea denitrificans]
MTPFTHKQSIIKIYNSILTILFYTTISTNMAHADTSAYPNCDRSAASNIYFNLPASINIATIPANAPTITPATNWFTQSALSFTGCRTTPSTNIYYTFYNHNSTSPPQPYTEDGLTYFIYPLGNGIGIVTSVQNLETGTGPTSLQYYAGSTFATFNKLPIIQSGNFSTIFRYRLVRYSNSTNSGTFSIPQRLFIRQADWQYSSSQGWTYHTQDITLSAMTINIQTKSCSVNTSNIAVQLPAILPTSLPSVGSTTGTTPFNIAINCPSPVNVYMTITDNSAPLSTSDTLSATSNSSAQGIGIQIRRNGLPIWLGPDNSMAGNTNQFLVGNNTSGNLTIPFTANYIRTSAINVGKINAIATFTFSYQ